MMAPAKALAIVELRRKRLTQARIAQALGVAARTFSRVLARAGLSRLADLERAEPLLAMMGVADAVIGISADVVRVMALAFPAQLILIAASNFLEGISHPRRVMVVNLMTLPLNALPARCDGVLRATGRDDQATAH